MSRRIPLRYPRIGTSAAVAVGVVVSLAPGLLPRTSTAQGLLTGLLVAVSLAFAGGVRKVLSRYMSGGGVSDRWRGPAVAVGVVAVGAAVAHAQHWQNALRAAMGLPDIDGWYWPRCLSGAALDVGLLAGIGLGVRWVWRRLGPARGVGLVVVAVLAAQFVLLPTVAQWRQSAYAAANAAMDPAVVQPVSSARSGSAVSAVSWPSLGAEGRKFVAGAPNRSVRVYVGLESAADLNARVELAIRELERSGGLTRGNLVVVVPTGSGWIDARAAAGLDERFAGDVALVGLQYSEAPSWATFVFGRKAAETSARALFAAVERRLDELPVRPKLYVYGQSLGAAAGSAVFGGNAEQVRRICAAVWAGPPANRVHRASATVLANSSDPVVRWSPRLLWHAPDLAGTRLDAPLPQWLPVISFVQTSVDLLGALGPTPGHGHRYGTDQGTAMGSC
ncbi:alpha/beta-hydrolase family protein [Nocardia aurantia]|uniref:alpha/beta-hydrolase family protein n=1 Tax=Nocardia aurantia TaxID=2585199 RepID=UPI0029E7DC56|nr:alpha/beta-hydrolase family protein [Nocardia aurantia]